MVGSVFLLLEVFKLPILNWDLNLALGCALGDAKPGTLCAGFHPHCRVKGKIVNVSEGNVGGSLWLWDKEDSQTQKAKTVREDQ